MIVLWSGRIVDPDSALQLLSIIDIVRFWAEYTYKPAICTCLSRLQAIKDHRLPVPFENTLWRSQIAINQVNTPWLFHQRRRYMERSARHSKNDYLEAPSTLRPSSCPPNNPFLSSNNNSSGRRRSSQGRNQRITTPDGGDYVIPEIENYSWILDRDPGRGDLLVIRIDRNGERRRPLVFFDTPDWTTGSHNDNINSILVDEMKRHKSNILPRFRVDRKGRNYLWNCGPSRIHHIRNATQFCAILPLDYKEYTGRPSKLEESQLFEPLELLLGVPVLLAEIEHQYQLWCFCSGRWNEYSLPMIQCRNANCKLEWYHLRCVGLNDDDDPEEWLCDTCCDIPEDERIDTRGPQKGYDKIVAASSSRVQRTRTLRRVWDKHVWPKADAVLRKYEKITMNVDLVKSAAYTISRTGVQTDLKTPRYWALSRKNTRQLIMASSREKQLVYHQQMTREDNSDKPDDADEIETSFTGEAVDDIEDALESMSLEQTNIFGRRKGYDH